MASFVEKILYNKCFVYICRIKEININLKK